MKTKITGLEHKLLRPSQIARRWHLSEEAVADIIKRGILVPAVQSGRSKLFALADIQRIEAGRYGQNPEHDFTVEPLTAEGRTSPVVLINRVELAVQAIDAAAHCQQYRAGMAVDKATLDLVGLIAIDLRGQVSGQSAVCTLPAPKFGPRATCGAIVTDPNCPPMLVAIAYAVLRHLMMSGDSEDALQDLGPKKHARMLQTLNKLEDAIRQVSTAD